MELFLFIAGILSYSYFPTIFSKYLWKNGFICNGDKKIMLTFDDGPDDRYTRELLDLLKREEIRASFFLVSDFAINHRDIVDRMRSEGHTIGLHSSMHKSILYRGFRYTKRDLELSLLDMDSLGIDIKYYRPPWGQINIFSYFLLREYNIRKILWNVMAEDWSRKLTDKDIEERLLERVRPGSIICLHDGRGEDNAPMRTIRALERVLPELKNEGYEFITVGEYYG